MLPPDDATKTQEEEQPNAADATDAEQEPEKQPEEPADGEEPKDGQPEGDEEGDETTKAGEPVPEPQEKPKKVGGWQRKIERLERQNQLLVEQLAGGRQNQPAPAAKADKDKTQEEKAAEYFDNLVEQRLAKREADQRRKAEVTDFQRRTAEVRAAKDDFDDVVSSADIPVASPLGQALLTSEHGPAIMYELAKNPTELARLCALPVIDAAREVGRLEAKLSSSTASPKTSLTAKRPPAPPTSVNGKTPSTRSLEDLPLSDYKRAYRSGRR